MSQTEDYCLGDTDSRSTWILFRWTTKKGRLIKAKPTKLYKFFKNYNWNWQEVRVFVKQGLVGVWNGCIVTLRPEGCSWQPLTDIVLRMAVGVLESDTVQKIQVLSIAGTCLKPHPQWPPSSILNGWTTATPFWVLNAFFSLMVKADVQCMFNKPQNRLF